MAKFLRYNGWGLKDIPEMVKNAGQNYANGDNNAGDEDPEYYADPITDEPTIEQIKLLWAAQFPDLKWENEVHPILSKVLLGTVVSIARKMTHKSVAVVFGRDMYPVQEVLRVIGYKLRGTWIYVEGASRSLSSRNDFKKHFANKFDGIMKKADVIFGVDTGYSGTVPREFLEKWRPKLSVQLISTNGQEKRAWGESDKHARKLRSATEKIEDFSKPYLRAHEVVKARPVLRLGNAQTILISARFMCELRDLATEYLPFMSMLMNKETDLLELFIFNGRYPTKEEEEIEQLEKEITNHCTCTVPSCVNGLKTLKKRLAELKGLPYEDGPLLKDGDKPKRVMLVGGSNFRSQALNPDGTQCKGWTTPTCCDCGGWIEVKWDNGSTYHYPQSALIDVEDKDFQVGDMVIGNSCGQYTITKAGWIGKVIKDRMDSNHHYFYVCDERHLKDNPHGFPVEKKHFNKYYLPDVTTRA